MDGAVKTHKTFYQLSLPFYMDAFGAPKTITISVLYRAHLCMKCSLGISNFLEGISSFSHSIVFLYFCIAHLGRPFFFFNFKSLLAILWNSAFSWVYLYLLFLFFSQLFVRPPQTTTLPSCISFSLGWFSSPPPIQCYESPSIDL